MAMMLTFEFWNRAPQKLYCLNSLADYDFEVSDWQLLRRSNSHNFRVGSIADNSECNGANYEK